MSEKYKVGDQDMLHFVTFAVVQWVDVFTRQMYRDILLDSLKHCQKEKGLVLSAWCLMSNHIHMIVGREEKNMIEEIIRDFKKYTSVHICRAIEKNPKESRRKWMLEIFRDEAINSKKHQKYCFWQNSYHPIELSYTRIMDQKLNYTHDNPVKAGIVECAEDYLYSSARNYVGMKGLIEVDLIE